MLIGLSLLMTDHVKVRDNIMSHGLEAKDIRLIRKKDTGNGVHSFIVITRLRNIV